MTSLAEILNIAHDPWRARAACRGAEPEVFDGRSAADEVEALGYCRTCPVIAQCMDWVRHDRKFTGIAAGRVWSKVRKVDAE